MMIRFIVISILLLCVGPLIAAPVDDIKLAEIRGQVVVNTGASYLPGHSGMSLSAGFKVMLSSSSFGQIIYSNGCKQTLDSNTIVVVSSAAECKAGLFHVSAYNAKAVGASSVVAASATGKAISNTTLLALIGGGAAAAAVAAGGGHQSPNISSN